MDYSQRQWQFYLTTKKPEHLRRLASAQNWLTREEEEMEGRELPECRLDELRQMAAGLMGHLPCRT